MLDASLRNQVESPPGSALAPAMDGAPKQFAPRLRKLPLCKNIAWLLNLLAVAAMLVGNNIARQNTGLGIEQEVYLFAPAPEALYFH